MVSANNTPKAIPQARIGSFIVVVVLLAWAAIVVATASLVWNNRMTMSGSEWANRAANGTAICLAVVYLASVLVTVWLLVRLSFYPRKLMALSVFCLGVMPAVLCFWGFLESKLNFNAKNQVTPLSAVSRLSELDSLAHIRLMGGSLWQPVEVGTMVQLIRPASNSSDKAVLEQLDEYVQQIRDVTGSESKDRVLIHFKPPLAIAVGDAANWIAFDKPIRKADGITENVWRHCAQATLRGDLQGDARPPTVLTVGYVEYFSRNTDEIMDDYFHAASKSNHLRTLDDLTKDRAYAEDTTEHRLVGAAFATYLIEDMKSKDFLALCQVDGREGFESAVQKRLGMPWVEVCNNFNAWLKSEADRLGWQLAEKESTEAGDRSENGSGALQAVSLASLDQNSDWNDLVQIVKPLHDARKSSDSAIGIDVKTKLGENLTDAAIEFDERLRALQMEGGRWLSNADEKGELSIVVTSQEATQAERPASKLLRQTHAIESEEERTLALKFVDTAIRECLMQGDLISTLDHYVQGSENWAVTSITRGSLDADWRVELACENNLAATLVLTVDPKIAYRVKEVKYVRGKEKESISRTFIPHRGDFIVDTEEKNVSEKKTSLEAVRSMTKYHIMTAQQAGSFREELAYMKQNNDMQQLSAPTSTPLQVVRWLVMGFTSFTALAMVAVAIRK